MTKILKVRVKREVKGALVHYVYPVGYDAQLIDVTCYEFASNKSDPGVRLFEYCIGVVADKDAPTFLKSADVIEIDKNAALEAGRLWRPQYERITDAEAVLSICAKVSVDKAITASEKDAIDSSHIASGIGMTPAYDAVLIAAINKMGRKYG